jgi:hypothetical protein
MTIKEIKNSSPQSAYSISKSFYTTVNQKLTNFKEFLPLPILFQILELLLPLWGTNCYARKCFLLVCFDASYR